jgi:hypothetical protein
MGITTGAVPQDGDGNSSFKSFTFAARDAANGENFSAGFYNYATSEAALTQASLTQNHGSANVPYAAHAFCVAKAAGVTDGTDLVLTVSGTSINDAGTRTPADSEVVVADAEAAATDQYFETAKKWLGTVVFTLSSSGGAAFNFSFNYGFCKYEDFGNRRFTLQDFEVVGLCNASDGGFELDLLHHKATGWTYAATGFVAGTTPLASMTTIHSTESDPDAGEYLAFKRANMNQPIAGHNSEGLIIRVTTSVNNSMAYLDSHLGVRF